MAFCLHVSSIPRYSPGPPGLAQDSPGPPGLAQNLSGVSKLICFLKPPVPSIRDGQLYSAESENTLDCLTHFYSDPYGQQCATRATFLLFCKAFPNVCFTSEYSLYINCMCYWFQAASYPKEFSTPPVSEC